MPVIWNFTVNQKSWLFQNYSQYKKATNFLTRNVRGTLKFVGLYEHFWKMGVALKYSASSILQLSKKNTIEILKKGTKTTNDFLLFQTKGDINWCLWGYINI